MASKSVATEADVQVQAGQGLPAVADAGTWAPKPATVQADAKITIAGAPAIYEATCAFAFTGTKNGAPVTAPDDVVTLTAADTKLQSQHHVLRDGDSAQSQYGNTVKIVSTRKLTSA